MTTPADTLAAIGDQLRYSLLPRLAAAQTRLPHGEHLDTLKPTLEALRTVADTLIELGNDLEMTHE